ncbi:GyrI-like domain-containing protein [Aeromicrobium duanguangcaii]|uniref:GyrI-like domain-containing protein n=1 Tax=Aeromicrobium duanguangcaii TaxID=2968086 RepID=A0ABY5KDE9_9ACTN|nr:GyrI-like domain-containing protein [Aeromicrobium duanguangcaii]MCD9154455.1 GyrI-like domain-containing protein [Aeromicrobium duanguangcaii]MCL3838203.1 GyrI-like domain-containing protein [Aeromicrobium duanguangcaii]UUI68487.1 GyrI-like domain-containing protein [Aeromicrobium duanguangcaii]
MKFDVKKQIPTYTAPRGRFEVVTVPPMTYLMVDGEGDPNRAPRYQDALGTLYPTAYALKFLSKTELDRDYVVPPLEGLWWSDDFATFTSQRDKSRWSWTMMILVPDWITDYHLDRARSSVTAKGGAPLLDEMRLESLDEGRCVQTLHVGSYDDEGPVLAAMHDEFIPAHGLRMTGRHHEIYLGDPRRTAPERLRTILRQPVEAAR